MNKFDLSSIIIINKIVIGKKILVPCFDVIMIAFFPRYIL